jgi:hypothetical protein
MRKSGQSGQAGLNDVVVRRAAMAAVTTALMSAGEADCAHQLCYCLKLPPEFCQLPDLLART